MNGIYLMRLGGFVLQLSSIGVENEEGARRNLRELLFTSPNVSDYISGVVRGMNYYCSGCTHGLMGGMAVFVDFV